MHKHLCSLLWPSIDAPTTLTNKPVIIRSRMSSSGTFANNSDFYIDDFESSYDSENSDHTIIIDADSHLNVVKCPNCQLHFPVYKGDPASRDRPERPEPGVSPLTTQVPMTPNSSNTIWSPPPLSRQFTTGGRLESPERHTSRASFSSIPQLDWEELSVTGRPVTPLRPTGLNAETVKPPLTTAVKKTPTRSIWARPSLGTQAPV